MHGVVTLLAIYSSAGVAGARQNTDCVPIPFVIPRVALVEPQVAPIFDPRGVWIEFSVVPFGGDIRKVFVLSATATPLHGGPAQRLNVDGPYRLSGDTPQRPDTLAGLWIAHMSNPDLPSRVAVSYSVAVLRTPSGGPCDGPLLVRPIGEFTWSPTNGVGPFGLQPFAP